jgi:hypothetical protein
MERHGRLHGKNNYMKNKNWGGEGAESAEELNS